MVEWEPASFKSVTGMMFTHGCARWISRCKSLRVTSHWPRQSSRSAWDKCSTSRISPKSVPPTPSFPPSLPPSLSPSLPVSFFFSSSPLLSSEPSWQHHRALPRVHGGSGSGGQSYDIVISLGCHVQAAKGTSHLHPSRQPMIHPFRTTRASGNRPVQYQHQSLCMPTYSGVSGHVLQVRVNFLW